MNSKIQNDRYLPFILLPRATAFTLIFSLILWTAPVNAAMQMFMIIDGVQGESKDSTFPGSIETESIEWGVDRLVEGAGSGQQTSGDVNFGDLTVSKRVDTSSADLFFAAATGQHYDDVTIILRKSGEEEPPVEFFAFKLIDASVVSVYTAVSGDDTGVLEQVTFNYRKIQTFYRPTDEGSKDEIKEFCYDIQANVDC